MTRRNRGFILLGLALFGLVVGVDAFWIEPYRIEVTRHSLNAPLTLPLKIAHLTDLHTSGLGRRERQLLMTLDVERPDIIVITGDTIRAGVAYKQCGEVLKRLHAPLGVWFVRGNWENWRPVPDEQAFYESVGVHFLLNTGQQVREDVWIAGFDDAMSGQPDLSAALARRPAGIFTIALFHSPIYFEEVAGQCDLALAGHTHGGQVRLPFIRPLWLPAGCGRFVEGWYEQAGSRLYVSRGLGTTAVNVRFFCRPELAFITVGK